MRAELELEIAQINAKASIAKAKARRDAEIKTLEATGMLYEKYPEMFELELAAIQAETLSSIQATFISNGSTTQYNNLLGQQTLSFSPFGTKAIDPTSKNL